MRKLKRTCKKAKGLKARAQREEFLDRLKNPQKYVVRDDRSANEIIQAIRNRRNQASPSPYLAKIRQMAGLE